MLGLPDGVNTCLFDLDGVLTKTAKVHAAAWKQMFDAFLRETQGEDAAPFTDHDYDAYVDGKTRYDGVRSFLDSRASAHDEQPVHQLGDRKNELVLELIHDHGVENSEGSVHSLKAARDAGLRRAV